MWRQTKAWFRSWEGYSWMVWDFITRFRRVRNLKCMNYVWNLPVHSENVAETVEQISAGEEGCLHSDARSSSSISSLLQKQKMRDIGRCQVWGSLSCMTVFLLKRTVPRDLGLSGSWLWCCWDYFSMCPLPIDSTFSLHPFIAYSMQTTTKLKASNKHARHHGLSTQC